MHAILDSSPTTASAAMFMSQQQQQRTFRPSKTPIAIGGINDLACNGLSSRVDESFEGLVLTSCDETENNNVGQYEIVSLPNSDLVQIQLLTSQQDANPKCLAVKPLKNEGGAYGERGGAQVMIGVCDTKEVKCCCCCCLLNIFQYK